MPLPQPIDRHARWSVPNVQDAIGQYLYRVDGRTIHVSFGHPWVILATPEGSEPIDSAVGLATYLNHCGALPRAEHRALEAANG